MVTKPSRPELEHPDRRQALSWAFYDWANSAFATTVIAGFFPIFFKQYWSAGAPVTESTFWLGTANSLASLLIAILAPLLGAIADRGGARKRFLLAFAALGIVMTSALYGVAQGQWVWAATLYGLALIGFSAGNLFYDALLVGVASERQFDVVSALGYGLGYLGGGLLFALNVLMTLYPGGFGLADTAEAVRVSFVTVALWWALFSIPLLLWVPEPPAPNRVGGLAAIRAGLAQLRGTFHQIRRLRAVGTFLLAYWFYIDGVNTVIHMAVDYGLALGFPADSLIVALLIVQFVGFPAAVAFGRLGERWGPRTGIFIAIAAYVLIAIWGYFIQRPWEFYGLATAIGLVQGGIQSLSRSLYARLIPAEQSGEFFGFFNMLGKFAAVLGPVLMGAVSLLSGNPRLSILSLLVLFAGGALLLARVDEAEGRHLAGAL